MARIGPGSHVLTTRVAHLRFELSGIVMPIFALIVIALLIGTFGLKIQTSIDEWKLQRAFGWLAVATTRQRCFGFGRG